MTTAGPPVAQSAGTGRDDMRAALLAALAGRPIVLVGMMGAGKTSVGRRLAQRLERTFVDSDEEIEKAAGMAVSEIFSAHGEPEFRAGEARVIARILRSNDIVLATGGGAFMNADTRALILASSASVFIKADFELLFARVARRSNRPLLKTDSPRQTLRELISERYPIYALADVTVMSRDVPQDVVATDIITALAERLVGPATQEPSDGG